MTETVSAMVTVLFTDVAGSTRLWEEHADEMASLLARHDEVLRTVVAAHGGKLVKSMGDGVLAVFNTAHAGVEAAAVCQRALLEQRLPAVRMAVHTGEVIERDGDYFGPTLNRAARLMGIGHGGQVLVSAVTQRLVGGDSFRNLGWHRLRDLSEREEVFQLLGAGLLSEFPALRSVDAFPTNLPVQLSSFVGRDEERSALGELLRAHRMVTITGVGGVGKTRLVLAAAAEALDRFDDGVWLVELEKVFEAARVVDAIAAALHVRPAPDQSLESALLEWMFNQHLLLVLDNCEHLVAESARVSTALLRRAPNISIVTTSREPLIVQGEVVFHVRPMDIDAAVQLFFDRAAAADAASAAEASVDDVARVCRGLDGIPLAVELAAARLRSFGARELAQRLDQRFRVLTGGRGAIDRHQTLRATVDWSYNLLSPADQKVLARLSVFPGGCSLQAAEAVIADEDEDDLDVLAALADLTDKSLAYVDHGGVGVRYRLLETVRVYAAEKLAASGDAEGILHRHAVHFHGFARQAARGLFSADEHRWAALVEPELDNLRIAVDWATETGETDLAMGIAAAFIRQGLERPLWGTAAMAETALRSPGADGHPLRGRVLGEAALAALRRGDARLSWSRLETAMDAVRHGARFTVAPWSYAMTHTGWGHDVHDLLTLAEEAISLADAAGDRIGVNGMSGARCLWISALGRHEEAREAAELLVREATALGQPALLANTYMVYAHTLIDTGRYDEAIQSANRSLDLVPRNNTLRASGLQARAIAEALRGHTLAALEPLRECILGRMGAEINAFLGWLHAALPALNALGRPDLTARLAGASSSHQYMDPHPQISKAAFDSAMKTLGEHDHHQLVREGAALTPDQLADLVLTWIDDVTTARST